MQNINWSILPLLLMVVQGIILLLFLLVKRRQLGNEAFWLIGLCFFAVATLTDSILYLSELFYQVPHLIGVALPISLVFPPLILGYIRSMLGGLPSKIFLWHFFPFALCVTLLLPFYFLPSDVKLLFYFDDMEHPLIASPIVFTGLVYVFLGNVVQFPIYYYLCRRALKNQTQFLKALLSSEQLTKLTWLHTLLNFSLLIWVLSCFQILLGAALQITDQLVWWINFLIGTIIYLFNYYALHQQSIFNQVLKRPIVDIPFEESSDDASDQQTTTSKYQKSSIDGNISKEVLADIQRQMTLEQLYLDPLLSLPIVSAKTGHSTHHVSQAINQNLKVNFFDYVNNLRVEHAKAVLLNNTQTNVLDVALACGFNSKSAFYKAFKKVTLTTPLKFRTNNE